MLKTLAFTVYGVALPKGNHRAFTPKGMKFPIVTESNRSVASWQQLVAQGASEAIQKLPEDERLLFTGAVRLTAVFYLPRPKSLSKRGVFVPHLKAPDLDKLIRSIGDALSMVVYLDDKQVIELVAAKRYAAVDSPPRIDVCIEQTSTDAPPPREQPLFSGAQ